MANLSRSDSLSLTELDVQLESEDWPRNSGQQSYADESGDAYNGRLEQVHSYSINNQLPIPASDGDNQPVCQQPESMDLELDYLKAVDDGALPSYSEAVSQGAAAGPLLSRPPGFPQADAANRAVSIQTDTNINPAYRDRHPVLTRPPTAGASGDNPPANGTKVKVRSSSRTNTAAQSKSKKLNSAPAEFNCDRAPPSGLKVDLPSIRSTRSRSKKKEEPSLTSSSSSSGSKARVRVKDDASISSSVSGATSNGSSLHSGNPDGNYNFTANGASSYTITVNGLSNDITINNNIDFGIGRSSTRSGGRRISRKSASQVKIPAKGSTRRLLPDDIEILSRKLGNNWEQFGLIIGVHQGEIDNIRYEYDGVRDQREMTRQMLKKWQAEFGHDATINYIIDALTDDYFKLYDVAASLPKDP